MRLILLIHIRATLGQGNKGLKKSHRGGYAIKGGSKLKKSNYRQKRTENAFALSVLFF